MWCFEAILLVELYGRITLTKPKVGIIKIYTSGCPKNQKRC
jgi:hypothetical protein